MNNDEKWMALAIKQAVKADKEGEVPVGAVLVHDDKLIAKSYNQSISNNDASAHAEIQVLRKAGSKLNNYRLNNSTLYVTLEPCAMCLGALVHARISNIVFGAFDFKTGVCGSCVDLTSAKFFNHTIKIDGGVLEDDCMILMKSFFSKHR